jgi:hypothetical protein
MYLLKLRHGDAFCTATGSSWRLIFVYVLMPWLSKYRAMRRAVLGYEDDSATILSARPLRAESLVDARAYALRAVSLIPAVSDVFGESSRDFRRPTYKDEIRELRMENRRLRMQVKLLEKEALKSEDETYVPPPPMPSPISSPVVKRGSKDLEPDEERTPSPPHQELTRYFSAGLTELDGRQPRQPSRPALKRGPSAGLSNLRSPVSNLHQLSWKTEE